MLVRFLISLVFISLLLSCGSDPVTGPGEGISATRMIGLTDNHVLTYNQIDTTIVYEYHPDISPDPIRMVYDTSRSRTITMSLDESNRIISDNSVRMLNLIVSGGYVLHNGLYSNFGEFDSLVYSLTPAIIMPDSPTLDQNWEYTTGPYQSAGEDLTFPFYFAYFGYHASKTYVGREEVLVTAGLFNAHRFEIDLYLSPTDENPVAHATEYFSVDEGLVKLRFEDSGFVRTLILVSSD